MADDQTKDTENTDTDETDLEENSESENEGGEGKENSILDDANYTPPVRKSIGDYVVERREKRFERQQQQPKKKIDNEEEDNEGNFGENDIEEKIQRGIKNALEGLSPIFASQMAETEISSFLSRPGNENFRKYEKLVRKDATVYPNVPIEKLFRAHAFDDAQIIGSQKSNQRNQKVNQRKISGTSRRSLGQPANPAVMSKESKDQVRLRILTGEKINPEEIVE